MGHSEQETSIPFDLPRQRIEDDSYIPSDEEIREIHGDENRWAEPDLALAAFERWLDAHDERIRREVLVELGVLPESLPETVMIRGLEHSVRYGYDLEDEADLVSIEVLDSAGNMVYRAVEPSWIVSAMSIAEHAIRHPYASRGIDYS